MSGDVLGVAPVSGLDISGVLYRYTAVKERPDDFTVTIRNANAIDGGYIFQSTDDWSGKSGQTITKAVPVAYSPIKYWGDGEIATTGVGSVEDPQVVYTYRFIEPEVEQTVPSIPALYSALDDPYAQTAAVDRERLESDDDLKDKEGEEEKEDMEKALATGDADLNMAVGQTGMIAAMNPVTMRNYYAVTIPGGVYRETIVLKDAELPDNRRAFRSMANDRLHNQMVEEQWR